MSTATPTRVARADRIARATRRITQLTVWALAIATLGACASAPQAPRPDTLGGLRQGPGQVPQRNVTDFSGALRCMDETMYTFGTRDVVMMVEDLRDESHRLGAGTRDMMISAVSEMTRRSRAVRLVTAGFDSQNVQFLLQQLEKRMPFGVLPQYDIRGSVTQFDEDVVRKDASLGTSGLLRQLVGLRANAVSQAHVLGFDASVVTVPELTLVPGATSKNTVIVTRDEKSLSDGQASIHKVGLSFNMSVSRNAGMAQALRNMVELSAVELVGKVTRVPYWACLGLTADHPEVRREIEDWHFGMRDDAERNRFYQEQLRFRRFYDGPADGRAHEALNQALAAYKKGLGFAESAPTDLRFFTEFLSRPVPPAPPQPFATGPVAAAAAPTAGAAAVAGIATASATASATATVTVTLNAKTPAAVPAAVAVMPLKPSVKVGEEIELAVQSARAGYLYCYIQSGPGGAIQRVFPNRNQRDPRIEADQLMTLPGGQGFRITADKPGTQKLACLVAPREVYNDLPPPLRWGDFEDVRLKSFGEIKDAFERAGKLPVVMDEVTVSVGA